MKPFDLNGLKTYELRSRPSKVFVEDLGHPLGATAAVSDWLDAMPRQLAGNVVRRVRDHLCRAHDDGKTVVAALGGHVIKTGCGPYLIDWINKGIIKAVAMNGSAAIHDFELALVGKTSEDVSATLSSGQFGMAAETADAFAIAARAGADKEVGLGSAGALHRTTRLSLRRQQPSPGGASGAYSLHHSRRAGTDIVHMHPHVSGAALGEASHVDFRRLCTVVSSMAQGVWLNLGSAVVLPEVLLKAVSVVHNFGYNLDGLTTVNIDKESRYRSTVNVLNRPSSEGLELIGHHEILLPLLHAAVAAKLATRSNSEERRAA